jgi:hypothetical protein
MTTRTGAVTVASTGCADAWLVRVVRENARAYPGRRHGRAQEYAPNHGHGRVPDERADQHQAGDEVGLLGRGEHG